MNKCIYVHIYEELFFQNMISEHGSAIATSRFGLALNVFWKRTLHMFLLLKFYILATSKVISGWEPTCDRVLSW